MSMPYMVRSVHATQWLRKFISEARTNTIILFGNQQSADEIFPYCLEIAKQTGTLFWCASPGRSHPRGYEFHHLVLDKSWDQTWLTQRIQDWAEAEVIARVSADAKSHFVP